MCPRRGVQVLFAHQKQWSPLLGSSLPWAFTCWITNRSTLPVIIKKFKQPCHTVQQHPQKRTKERANKVVFKSFPVMVLPQAEKKTIKKKSQKSGLLKVP